jgi:hypothetical protein
MAISLPPGFQIEPVAFLPGGVPGPTPAAPLGVLSNFTGSFKGTGLNTIFRPKSGSVTGTIFPSDNVLELNLINDTISFATALGSVPNRGFALQDDILLNGIPYIQIVNDVTNKTSGKGDGDATGIHFEPGLWMNVPATDNTPVLGDSLVRMGSIPHGTTINAACREPTKNFAGPPEFPKRSLKPFPPGGGKKLNLNSLNASNIDSLGLRIPSDLTNFIAAGTITQDILDDPNTVLRQAIEGQTIIQTTTFTVRTTPLAPDFGGGATNIAFLEGNGTVTTPNANAFQMNATFWIETVEYLLVVPIFKPGQAPLLLSPASCKPAPTFLVNPPYEITAPKTITVTSIQIQYSQIIFLLFDQLVWPHMTVSTLIPGEPINVTDSVVWN